MHLRPFLEVTRIKPEEIETVMQLLPIGELIRNCFVKANPFWRHFKIAARTREWVWGQVWLKQDCGERRARANLIVRRRWWRTQLPIWVIFGLHRFFNVRLTPCSPGARGASAKDRQTGFARSGATTVELSAPRRQNASL